MPSLMLLGMEGSSVSIAVLGTTDAESSEDYKLLDTPASSAGLDLGRGNVACAPVGRLGRQQRISSPDLWWQCSVEERREEKGVFRGIPRGWWNWPLLGTQAWGEVQKSLHWLAPLVCRLLGSMIWTTTSTGNWWGRWAEGSGRAKQLAEQCFLVTRCCHWGASLVHSGLQLPGALIGSPSTQHDSSWSALLDGSCPVHI